VYYSIFAGIAAGLFFGEAIEPLKLPGTAFVRALQMTTLPYLVVAMIRSIGSLDATLVARMGRRLLAILTVGWVGVYAMIFPVIHALPPKESAGNFSHPQAVEGANVDHLEIFVPSNPFHAMANAEVPALALFCGLLGFALMGNPRKGELMSALTTLEQALGEVSKIVMKVAPYSTFCLFAVAAGTLSLDELGRVQLYVLLHYAVSFLLFGGLFVSCAMSTGLPMARLGASMKDALVLAVSSNSLFVALPLIKDAVEGLYDDLPADKRYVLDEIEVMLPLIFIAPGLNQLLGTVFVGFVGWYYGEPLGLQSYLAAVAAGWPAAFGGMTVSIIAQLDAVGLPTDSIALYRLAQPISGLIMAGLGVMATVWTLCVYVAWESGRLQWPKIAPATGSFAVATVATTVAGRLVLGAVVPAAPVEDHLLDQRFADAAPAGGPQAVPTHATAAPSRLWEILTRGAVRVGVDPTAIPFAFENSAKEIVGFDVGMARDLAATLGVSLTLVPIREAEAAAALDRGDVDVVMSGLALTGEILRDAAVSEPYRVPEWTLVVLDRARDRWVDGAPPKAKIAAIAGEVDAATQRAIAVDAAWEEVPDADTFFADGHGEALLVNADVARALLRLHPRFGVVAARGAASLVYAAPAGDEVFIDLIDRWIGLARTRGVLEELEETWIVGQGDAAGRARWCVASDVLHLW